MTWASVVTALGLWLGGLGVLRALGPRRPRSGLERHATAVMLGVALVPAVLVALTVAFGPLSPLQGRLLLGVFAAGGVLALVRGFPEAPLLPEGVPGEEPAGGLVRTGVALLLLFAAFAVFNAGSMPMHVFDPVYHFAYKGKLIFHEGFDTPAWKDLDGSVGRIITHPEYPPGVPALEALLACVNGSFDEDAARALMALFVLGPAAWLWCALRGRSRAAAVSAALLWVSLPFLYYTQKPHKDNFWYAVYGLLFGPEKGARTFPDSGKWAMPDGWTLDGAGDLPIAALFFGAFLFLGRLLPGSGLPRDRADVGTAAILLGGVLLAKNEGQALCAVLTVAVGLTLLVRRLAGSANADAAGGAGPDARSGPHPALALVACLAVAALLYAPWAYVRRNIPVIGEDYPSLLTPAGIWSRTARAGKVWSGFRESFTWILRWDLLWPLFFATLAWALARPQRFLRHPALPAVLVVFGAFALYFLILLVTPWDLDVLFDTVIPGRLILHVTPIAILALGSLLWRTRAEAGLEEPPG